MFIFLKKYKNDRFIDNVIFKYEKKEIVLIQRGKKMKKKKKNICRRKTISFLEVEILDNISG